MKKTLGYAFKLKNETFEQAMASYTQGWTKTKAKAKQDIQSGIEAGRIKKDEKPQVFKVIVEVVK